MSVDSLNGVESMEWWLSSKGANWWMFMLIPRLIQRLFKSVSSSHSIISFASAACTVPARADLQNIARHEIVGNQIFEEYLHATAHFLPELVLCLHPGDRMTTLSTSLWSGGHSCPPKWTPKWSQRSSTLQRLNSAASNNLDQYNVHSWELHNRCLQHLVASRGAL